MWISRSIQLCRFAHQYGRVVKTFSTSPIVGRNILWQCSSSSFFPRRHMSSGYDREGAEMDTELSDHNSDLEDQEMPSRPIARRNVQVSDMRRSNFDNRMGFADRRRQLTEFSGHRNPGFVSFKKWLDVDRVPNVQLESRMFNSEGKSDVDFEQYGIDTPVKLSGTAVKAGYAPDVVDTFSELTSLDPRIMSNIQKMGLKHLTPVQKYALPVLRDGHDLMASAQTGSGKTVAFLVPLVNQLISTYPEDAMKNTNADCQYPSALVLAPTRELVQQILLEAKKVIYSSYGRAVGFFGGQNINIQLTELTYGCHIAVATPGRITDLLMRGNLSLEFCKFLILDEADRMLDMGFEPQIRKILENPAFKMPPPEHRTTGLFSATFPKEVLQLASDLLKPEHVSLSVGEREGQIPRDISHEFILVQDHERERKFLDLMRNIDDGKRILIFCDMKRDVDRLDRFLFKHNFQSASIHGDKNQSHRSLAVDLFKKGRANILVATSVASRGLDVSNVTHVINFGFPKEVEEYIHRAGRTGRMGQKGKVISLVSHNELEVGNVARDVARLLKKSEIAVPDFIEDCLHNSSRPANSFKGRMDGRSNDRRRSSYMSSELTQRYGRYSDRRD